MVTLAVRNRVSRRATTELARELFGVELSTGTVDAIVQRAGEALAAPHTRLEQELKRSPVVNIDETGWKTGGERRTLWGALTRTTAVFRIAAGRHASEAQIMLGERYGGIVCSDRYPGYDYLDPARRQVCWAHLLRDFTAHSEGMGEQQDFGSAGLLVAHDLFKAWQQFQQDGDRAALQTRIAPLQSEAPRPSSNTPPARAPRPSTTGSSPATSSNDGPPSGPSPTPTTSNRPTTTPSAASAAPSSTASSHSAPNPTAANAASSDSSPPRSPAGCANNRSSPTSPR